jgi:hypothetical protein
MTDYEVERALGYTPCACGVIDGTWHPECYKGKTRKELAEGHRRAMLNARRHLKKEAKLQAIKAIEG